LGLIISGVFLSLLSVAPDNLPSALTILVLCIVIVNIIVFSLVTSKDQPEETIRGKITGFAVGLFTYGKLISNPPITPGKTWKDLGKGLLIGAVISFIIMPLLFSEYVPWGFPSAPRDIALWSATYVFATLSAIFYNIRNLDASPFLGVAWMIVGEFLYAYGLALMILVRIFTIQQWSFG